MADKKIIDAMWDDSPIDVSTEVNFIWSIANKLRGTYQSDKYKDVIIPMVYKGNYNAGVNWIKSTTSWFVKHSKGAECYQDLAKEVIGRNI